MRFLAALAMCSLLALGLAGCSGDDDGGDGDGTSSSSTSATTTTTSSSSTSRSSTTSSSSTSTGPPPNRPPTGSITALLNGTVATFNLTGSDPDGDALSWTLAFGDGNQTNGTALPASLNHTYNQTGNLSVVFTLTDGRLPASYNVTLNVTGASGPVQSFAGEWAASNGHCVGPSSLAVPGAVWFPEEGKGVTYESAAVDAATLGKAFTASFAFIEGATGGVTFLKSDGAYAGRFITAEGEATVTETVPTDAATVVFFSCLGEPDPVSVLYTA